MFKRRITAMLEERDISALESIAENQRVSPAWAIRNAAAVYLSERRATESGKIAPSIKQGSS